MTYCTYKSTVCKCISYFMFTAKRIYFIKHFKLNLLPFVQ